MTTPHDIAAPLQALLSGLSRQGEQHLSEVQADLRQTTYLLGAAIDKLGKSFIGIHEAMQAQQALLTPASGLPATALQSGDDGASLQQRLAQLASQSRNHADAAITALQFEDMTTQLIGRIAGHVESLQAVLGAVGAGAAALQGQGDPAGASGTDIGTVLAALNRALDDRGAAPSAAGKAVAQTHMDSGDIELF